MMSLLRLFWDICRLRRGPQDLPYSPGLARSLVALGVGVDLLFIQFVEAGQNGLSRLFASLVMLLALPWLLLGLRGLQPRYVQTLSALAGTGLLFTLAFLPIALMAADMPAPDIETPPTRQQLAVGWLTLALVGWKLGINAHIWRHALNWPMFGGLLLAIGLFLLEIGLMRALFAP